MADVVTSSKRIMQKKTSDVG